MQSSDKSWKDSVVLQSKSLFVSAGHSMTDPGASGNGLREADLVLEFRDKVVQNLKDLGVSVTADGRKGENLPLREAARMAKTHDVAVELHFNSFSSPSASGTEVLSDAEGKSLAAELSKVVSDVLGITDRGAKAEDSGQHSRLAFVRAGGMILETAFISNPNDVEAFLAEEDRLAFEVAKLLASWVSG